MTIREWAILLAFAGVFLLGYSQGKGAGIREMMKFLSSNTKEDKEE